MAVWNWPYWPIVIAPIVGSFLGLLIVRFRSERSIIIGRSVCDSCGHTLGMFDLIPVASWLAAGARCRYCGARLSILHPVIELSAFGIAVWAAALSQGWALWITCWLGWSLIALAVIDWRTGLLPDALTLPFVPVGLLAAYLAHRGMMPYVLGALVGLGLLAGIRWLYMRLRGREGLGLGDVKLAAGAGAFVGWEGLPTVVLWAALASLTLALLLSLAGRKIALDQRIAFGPGLCIGLWLVWLYGPLR